MTEPLTFQSSARPIVVGGCGRSGTTLLRVMLDAHRNLCAGPESNLFITRTVTATLLDKLAFRFDVERDRLRGLRQECRSHPEFIDLFFDLYRRQREAVRWVEKTPRNIHQIQYVFDHFPKAAFVHVVRDPRDVVCSLRTHPRYEVVDGTLRPTGIRRPLAPCIERWVEDVSASLPWRDDDRYIEIRYEDLVGDPAGALGRLLDRVREPWDPAVLDYAELEGTAHDSTRFPQNPEATKPVFQTSVDRWTSDLTDEEVGRVESQTRDIAMLFGVWR